MGKIHNIFGLHQFELTRETSKAVEFRHLSSNEFIYLLHNKETTIVVDPRTVDSNKPLQEKSTGYNHNTAFKEFPKRKNNGDKLIPYGYAYKFLSENELVLFLQTFTGKRPLPN